MSEDAQAHLLAKLSVPRRAFLYAGLQIVAALVAVLCFAIPLPQPPAEFRIGEALRHEDGGPAATVTLPDIAYSTGAGDPETEYLVHFRYPGGEGAVWSVFLPRFIIDVRVLVNGVEIGNSGARATAGKAQLNLPFIATIPTVVLREGDNEVKVLVAADPPIAKHLESIYVGPDASLRPAYNIRSQIFQTLPLVFSAWRFMLAVLLAMIWTSRPKDMSYGYLTLALLAGAVRLAFFNFDSLESLPIAGMLMVFESALIVPFVLAMTGYRPHWRWSLLLIPGLLIPVVSAIGDPTMVKYAFLLLGPPSVLLHALAIGVVLCHAAIVRARSEAFLLGTAMSLIIVGVSHDILTLLNALPGPKYFFSVLFYSAMLIAFGTLLSARFVQALRKVDGFATQLIVKVAEAEDKLRQSFAREQARDRAEALAHERDRLMRDLHDGLGGQLVRIVALSERDGGETARIGEAARAALKDLRLVIDAMEDVDGDLLLALASWRERTEIQLRAHQVELDWQIRSKTTDLTFPELRPWHVIQIVRLMDEAVTNAVKHAEARTISVILRTAEGPENAQALHITIRDDGKGFDPEENQRAATGFGLANMRKRAALCGATLSIESGPYGTSIDVALPKTFPAAPVTV
ncbi:ATP-binding protein [Pseudomonas sp. R2.Fl]|nr:ATP-binding protein [Pseudomonas sp. R2.Fl]